jgi:hypothetical protein
MGEYADLAIEQEIWSGGWDNLYTYDPSIVWRTKCGEVMLIENMKTTHIENCINMIKLSGKKKWRIKSLKHLKRELKKRKKEGYNNAMV